MSFDPYEFDRSYSGSQNESIGQYTTKTFLWMFLGLMVTFGVGLFLYVSNLIYTVFAIPGIQFLLLIAELAVVIVLSARIQKLSVSTARGLFLGYSVLNGVVFSTIFFAYYLESLVLVFAATALYFGVLAAYGYFTKSDLSRLRPILMFGLVFLVIFLFASLFLPLGSFERMMCLVGMAIFMGFTAYDTQKIKHFYAYYSGYPDMLEKAAIFSALQLYLDFINLFLYLLRFVGRSKN